MRTCRPDARRIVRQAHEGVKVIECLHPAPVHRPVQLIVWDDTGRVEIGDVSSVPAEQMSTDAACLVDRAGLTSSATVTGINIDRTAPVVDLVGADSGATYALDQLPTPSCATPTSPLVSPHKRSCPPAATPTVSSQRHVPALSTSRTIPLPPWPSPTPSCPPQHPYPPSRVSTSPAVVPPTPKA